MALPVSFLGLTYADNTLKSNGQPETAAMSLPVTTLTAANYTAKRGLIDTLIADLNGLSIGNPLKLDISIDRETIGSGPAASSLSQRENKFLFRYHDNTTQQKFQASLPCADLTQLMPNSEFVDLSSGGGATLKTDFEAIVVSPDDASHAVTLDSIQFVGRNS